jgi:hypothetical protein
VTWTLFDDEQEKANAMRDLDLAAEGSSWAWVGTKLASAESHGG